MASDYIIRAGTAADQPALLAIVWKTVMANPRDRDALLAHPEAVQVPVDHLTPATACVADDGSAPAGFAIVLPRPDGQAELDGLFVDPALQRLGLGRRLVERARHLAGAMGAGELHVIGHDDALPFYLSMGFVQIGAAETQFGTAPLLCLKLAGG
ncbi:GNAT family N-acetyltransferase [Devosia sp. A16]|uniref:GNAT family N-acetyltransferase n=1 Tax=Devosia sp. A16 TaxID=1736675 RepID=UPI0006D8508A|nr:GNAT family N-acetyltransferase [Devosia sp. A16]